MQGFQTMANDICQRALTGAPIKASLIREFFQDADKVLTAANAVKAVINAFKPDIVDDPKPCDECCSD